MALGASTLGTVALGGGGQVTVDPLWGQVAFTVEGDLESAAEIGVDGGVLRFTVDSDLRLRTLIRGDDYRLVLVDLDGNRYAELPGATIGNPSWELNGPGGFDFTLLQDDPAAAAVVPIEREVQVWKGDTLLWQGPVMRPQANAQQAGFQAQSPEWYFSRRFFGKADRTNYVPFGDFEDGYGSAAGSGWNIFSSSPLEPLSGRNPANWESAISSDRAVTGTRSLYMNQIASGAPKYGVTASDYFEWEIDPGTVAEEGNVWTLTAYCYIPSDQWRGPRLDRGGLGLGRFSTTETVVIFAEDGSTFAVFPAPIEGGTTTIDELHPRDRWIRHTVSLVQPPSEGEPELIGVRLHCPNGAIYWDRVMLTLDEALYFEQTDQALICAGIVEHLQDPAYGKSDLGMALHTPLTGVLRDRRYRHSEHGQGIEALGEFPDLDDGLDWDVQVTPAGKTFRTHYPHKGTDRSADLVLEYGRNIVNFNWAWDGEAAASSVIMLGTGDGNNREEGFAEDPTLYNGITLENVSVAPQSEDAFGQIDTLDNRAAERLRTVRNPTVLEVTAREITDADGRAVPLLGIIETGDIVGVRIHRGVVNVEASYRIVRIVLDPTSDELTLTLNWWADA